MATPKDNALKDPEIQEEMDHYHGSQNPDEVKTALEGIKHKVLQEGKSPREAMGLSEPMMEGIYGYGYRLYNTGKYLQAIQLFRLLVMLDPTSTKYLFGLAAAYHMNKDWLTAGMCYSLTSLIDPKSPLPFFHASDCYYRIQDLNMAKQCLESCLRACQGHPENEIIQQRAQFMLQQLQEGKIVNPEESVDKIQEEKP